MMLWLAAACFAVAAFLFFCVPLPGTNLVGVGGRHGCSHVGGCGAARYWAEHVAVNIKNPNRSWVHDRGPQQESTFLPWTGVLKGG